MPQTGCAGSLQLCPAKEHVQKGARQAHTVTYAGCWSEIKRMDVWTFDYFKYNRSVMVAAAPSW